VTAAPADGLVAAAAALAAGEVSPTEATHAALDRIAAVNPQLNAFLLVRGEEAMAEAAALEAADRGGAPRGPLWGVPVAVKDVLDVASTPTTCASAALRNNVAAHDAATVARLRAAGAIVVGKLNTHELAYGPLTSSRAFGRAHNPWDTGRATGGSSGGSAAAIAAGLVTGTLGTDTAGSIRIPTGFCGVTGIRPSTGLVPSAGMTPLSWSVDTVGPIAGSVEDCALLLDVIAGRDLADPSSLPVAPPPGGYLAAARDGSPAGLRIGVLESLFGGDLDPRIAAAVRTAADALEAAGATLVPVEMPLLDRAGLVQQALQFAEASTIHRDLLREHYDELGADVRGRLLAGLFVPATAYVTALRVRTVIADGFRAAFAAAGVDCLLQPTLPSIAPRIADDGTVAFDFGPGVTPPAGAAAENLFRQRLMRYTAPWSLVGWPVVSAPCGFVDGMPVSVAFVGPRFGEAAALRAAGAYQRLTGWHLQRPPVHA
jgi:Asp-tRNA(Asn)/Glu-tRNA(Gln) amidotransferase A subunit family amidase